MNKYLLLKIQLRFFVDNRVNLAPSDLKKSGSHFDLPIALSLLMEANQFRIKIKEEFAFIGELSQQLAELELKGVLNCLSGRYWR